MKERPILFSGPMVRALLDGSKTQTRRVMKPQLVYGTVAGLFNSWYLPRSEGGGTLYPNGKEKILSTCPYGQPGDRLWVRETWRIGSWDDGCGFWIDYRDGPRKERLECPDVDLAYRLIEQTGEDLRKCNIQPTNGTMYEWTPGQSPLRWRPSIHMPRWASRITLEITSVRVERLQDISEADCVAEGIERPENMSAEEMKALDIWDGAERACFNALNQPVHQYRRLWDQINGEGAWAANLWVWAIEFRRLP